MPNDVSRPSSVCIVNLHQPVLVTNGDDQVPVARRVENGVGVGPIRNEVFAGNRHDATTLEEMVGHVEQLYGRAGRVWIMDRSLVSEKNVQFLRAGARRYILGT